MTITELSQNLGISSDSLIKFYLQIKRPIPNEAGFVLSQELIQIARENKELFATKSLNREQVSIEKVIEDLEIEFNRLLAKSTIDLFTEIKTINNLEHLVFSGHFKMSLGLGAGNFGFFEDILDTKGTAVYYPNYRDRKIKSRINKIFIQNGIELEEGARYLFQVELARADERKRQDNPYLLQTSIKKVQGTKKLNDIFIAIKEKEAYLNDIIKKNAVREKEFQSQEASANLKIENLNKNIESKNNEITSREEKLESVLKSFEITNNNLLKMENLIETLKERVVICKKLDFIRDDDETRYLDLLSAKEFIPTNHLDFESDFDKSFSNLSDHIHAYLYHNKNLIYTRFQIRNFLALLQTHDIIVLSGLSGSGKTQIIKAFAEALGGIFKIIPVKPNWTSSDDLIGYYNPLQMSFLPTPFTEAIVEAIQNPHQLYFICLDEMNLARVEYYFADFLSKLEERSMLPEIELYANHEEELFVSEFSTLLNLVESSIKGKKIKSWQDFLENDVARNKFFEMLGNTEKESMLQLHAKMKRRLIDILKFPSTIKIPANIRFIGAINVDETTHYFSPKILDRIHVVKFDNPLLFEGQVKNWFENKTPELALKPVYMPPELLSIRKEYPRLNNENILNILAKLKEINSKFLIPLSIDFGIRSIRQSLNYSNLLPNMFPPFEIKYGSNELENGDFTPEEELSMYKFNIEYLEMVSLSTIIIQKIFPRFNFDGSELAKNQKLKMEVVEEFQLFLSEQFSSIYDPDEENIDKSCSEYLANMIIQAKGNHSQFNYFA